MIFFERIRYKNILSTGDSWTTIDLGKNPETLIVGTNGSGKSTLLDALTFVLFDKPFRKVSKGRLVNSVNRKGLLVEINFRVGETAFMIRRGFKPNKFEVYKNKELINQDGNNRDYQDYLEKNILKMNFKSFTQVVVLGSSTFVPFMELAAADRRTIVEELLDIEIFSLMNVLAKARNKTLSIEILDLGSQAEIIMEKLKVHQGHLEILKATNQEKAADNTTRLEVLKTQIAGTNILIAGWGKSIEAVRAKMGNSEQILNDRRMTINGAIQENRTLQMTHQKTVAFFDRNNTCPTCTQDIDEDFKSDIIKDNADEIIKYEEAVNDNQKLLDEVVEKLKLVDKGLGMINNLQSKISGANAIISANNMNIDSLNREAEKTVDDVQIKTTQSKVDELIGKQNAMKEMCGPKREELETLIVVIDLLKDSGIKTQVIKQYLPVMNKYINDYMEQMNFPAAFELDDEFNETIKSQYRDEFTYANFSEGEKQRINLSLLLTWRKIAQMRNSAATNLLVLDEVFDSSLDDEGTEGFMQILKSFGKGTNVFVISHKVDVLFERFNHVLEFYKDGNFSYIKEKMD